MAKEITMPSMGADMTEGTIVKWLKQEGDKVSKGDLLLNISSSNKSSQSIDDVPKNTEKLILEAENSLKKVQEQKHQSVILNENDILITTVGSNLNHPESAVGRPIRVPTFAADSLLNQNIVF